ncbi:unnamed protein product [Prorocentrum cordatum]|uniref:Uncharacterized protein n=1 Tax=Prorocentrum cordatum TaxID=2364126 RepID=A0ABN9S1S0_9DINO|nr:unnamed protein product [Polarella glacialis]
MCPTLSTHVATKHRTEQYFLVGDPTALFKTRTQPREGWEKGEEPCPPKAARRSPYLIARGDDRKRAHSLHWIYKTRST